MKVLLNDINVALQDYFANRGIYRDKDCMPNFVY